ncbi:MAG: ATP-binding protein [Chitinophagaceae bacterium]
MKQFIICLLLLLPVFVEAQPQQGKLDSLHLALQNAANDTIRMDMLNQLAWYHYTINYDSARFYWGQSVSIAQKLKLKLYEAGILSSQAFDLSWSNYPKALELSLQALQIAEDPASEKNVWNLPAGHTPHNERLSTLGWIYFNIAQLYGNTDNTKKQISSLLQAINIAQSLDDSAMNTLGNLNLGNVYLNKLKKPDSALYFEQKALKLHSNLHDSPDDLGWVFGAIGTIYIEKKNFDSSRFALQKGLQLMQQQNNLAGIGGICLAFSNFYKTINKPDSSLLYAYKALETYKTFKDKDGIANAYSSISSAYGEQKRTDSAFAYLTLATVLHDSLNNVERKNLLTYQNANLDEQMRLKNLEKERIQTQAEIRTYAMLAGIVVFMVIAFLLYRNNRHRKKANELLQKQKEEIAKQKENAEQTLVELKSTQAQLIQSEKMASLGELTAGIAHEIQNPLNFVNNFSEINTELIEEAGQEMRKGNLSEAELILNNIRDNEEKINRHGKRADSIVKGMLQHSRSSTGIKELTGINKLADEYLRLSYQGLRAKDSVFNATIDTDFDNNIDKINIVPQDIGRVLLNLYNNAFYAVNEKKKNAGSPYEPTVSVTTEKKGNTIEIKVKDNGNGIPQNIIDKIFQPFFTTKPTGHGTGLGLSLSYDIVKAHGGEIKAETKEGQGSEFVVWLPV